MSSAAARAARKKVLLSKGNDRLDKLTSSARGGDSPVYTNVGTADRAAPTTEAFVGEETIMPTPPARVSPSLEPGQQQGSRLNGQGPSWINGRQEFLRALMSAPDPNSRTGQSSSEQATGDDTVQAIFNALMSNQASPPVGNVPGAGSLVAEGPPRSLFAKLRPLLHLLASWILLAFFAFFVEPEAYDRAQDSGNSNAWERWAGLTKRASKAQFGVQPVPFFWAFVMLRLMLHLIQILTKSDPVQPPVLLTAVLPSLPPKWKSTITNLLAYARMGGMLLDDIAGLVVGLGILVFLSSWFAGDR